MIPLLRDNLSPIINMLIPAIVDNNLNSKNPGIYTAATNVVQALSQHVGKKSYFGTTVTWTLLLYFLILHIFYNAKILTMQFLSFNVIKVFISFIYFKLLLVITCYMKLTFSSLIFDFLIFFLPQSHIFLKINSKWITGLNEKHNYTTFRRQHRKKS